MFQIHSMPTKCHPKFCPGTVGPQVGSHQPHWENWTTTWFGRRYLGLDYYCYYYYYIITLPATGGGVLCWACLCVCPRSYLWNHTSDLHQIFVHVNCGRGSVLFWQRCDTLCTSGFMDDAIFEHYVPALVKNCLHPDVFWKYLPNGWEFVTKTLIYLHQFLCMLDRGSLHLWRHYNTLYTSGLYSTKRILTVTE